MALVVNTNVTSLIAQRRLSINSQNLQKSMERLSSGYRINRAGDDAAGLSISQNLGSQIRRMHQNVRNTQDGISLLQVAEGGLSVMGDDLQRIRELTVQAANDTYDGNTRLGIANEINQLLDDMNRIARTTNFNGLNLLDGSLSGQGTAPIQVGPNSTYATNVVDLYLALTDARPGTVTGLTTLPTPGTVSNIPGTPPSVGSNQDARLLLDDIDTALQKLNQQRASIGSLQNKLESVSANLDMAIENFSAANSRIRDVDVASESADMTQAQILTQAATTVLAQTNALPQMILRLLEK